MLPQIKPMRLTLRTKAFDDPDYLFELKPDGFRAIAYIGAGECKLVSRNQEPIQPSQNVVPFVSLGCVLP